MSNFISNHVDVFNKTAHTNGTGSGALLNFGFNILTNGGSDTNIVRLPKIKHIGDIIRFEATNQMEMRCELGSGSNMSINGIDVQDTDGTADIKQLLIGANNKEYGFCIASSMTNWRVHLFDEIAGVPDAV